LLQFFRGAVGFIKKKSACTILNRP
jgi:hypothetical protein